MAGFVTRGGNGIVRGGRTWQKRIDGRFIAGLCCFGGFTKFNGRLLLIHEGYADGLAGACLHASRRFTLLEAAAAHVTFADDAPFRGILRHFIRAFHYAVLAPDALVIEVAHNARDGIFIVSKHGTAAEATRIHTMMTGGGDGRLKRCAPIIAVKQADIAPGFVVIEAVERVAGGDAGFAAGAFVQIDFKAILLAGRRSGKWDEVAVKLRLGG